jgi:hypothetical protein
MENGISYNWTNIFTVIILFLVVVFSFLAVVITLGQLVFKKNISEISWYISIKYSGIAVMFLLALGILFFFHILNWYWILGIVILFALLIFFV